MTTVFHQNLLLAFVIFYAIYQVLVFSVEKRTVLLLISQEHYEFLTSFLFNSFFPALFISFNNNNIINKNKNDNDNNNKNNNNNNNFYLFSDIKQNTVKLSPKNKLKE